MAASALLAAAAPALAEDGQMRVRLAGLDLASAAGARDALSRIRYSVSGFCEANAGRQSLARSAEVDACTARMTRKAVDQLGAPRVTALLGGTPAVAEPTRLADASR
jgi:UrcA family protein